MKVITAEGIAYYHHDIDTMPPVLLARLHPTPSPLP